MQVECYTLGAPRVGNSTFVADYNRHVPETWHIINDKDTVSLHVRTLVRSHIGPRFLYSAPDCVTERQLHCASVAAL